MLARLNYLLVILIWSTTPLAIKLGAESFTPIAGLTQRIAIAFAIGSIICTVSGRFSLNIRSHWILYFAASISLFPNMVLVYMAAEYISSGLIALLFGLTPFFTAGLSRFILGQSQMTPGKWLANFIACAGLVLIFGHSANLSEESISGIFLMLLSNALFSGSALWVKRLNQHLTVAPLEQALGAMLFSLPGMLITWIFIFGVEPIQYTRMSVISVLYLALFASLVGFASYYYILNHLSVETVSLIPLITPVLAIALGVLTAGETVTSTMVLGSGLILLALVVHQGFWKVFMR